MNLETIKKYTKAVIGTLIILILLSFYLFLRRGYFDLYIANKVFAGTSLIILALVLLIGSLGRYYQIFDRLYLYRKHLGIISFILAFLHGIISLFFLPTRFTLNYYLSNNVTFVLGLSGLVILGYLFLISFRWFIAKIDPKKWWPYQVWGSRIAGILVFLHLVLMKYPGWLKWYQNGGSDELVRPFMPPASIIAAAFGLFVILVRFFEFINKKLVKFITSFLFAGLILFIIFSFSVGKSKTPKALPIRWETCIKLYGSKILETYPERCTTIDNRSVTKPGKVSGLTPTDLTPSPMIDIPLTEIITENLDTPWSIVFLPDNKILVSERKGTVSLDGNLITTLDQVKEIGEGGLMGMAIHPDFESNHYVYFYYTYSGNGDNTLNRVVRMTFENNKLSDEKIIVDAIPGASNHNGGRIKFGPDKNLYITTGDAQNPSQAQDKNSLSGKVLRVVEDEKVTAYSYGHRNPQGIAWDDNGQLYITEHGRSGILSGLDELNMIEMGKNYGWPDIQGDETRSGMEKAVIHSGSDVWAPAGMAFYNGSFYFAGLRGSALYKVTIVNGNPELKEYFKGEFGRIRDVVLGPDNMLYISTSNLDGRGTPKAGDDKIIRINPEKLK